MTGVAQTRPVLAWAGPAQSLPDMVSRVCSSQAEQVGGGPFAGARIWLRGANLRCRRSHTASMGMPRSAGQDAVSRRQAARGTGTLRGESLAGSVVRARFDASARVGARLRLYCARLPTGGRVVQ